MAQKRQLPVRHSGREQPPRQHDAAEDLEQCRHDLLDLQNADRAARAAQVGVLHDLAVHVIDPLAVLVHIVEGHLLVHIGLVVPPPEVVGFGFFPVEGRRAQKGEHGGRAQDPEHQRRQAVEVPIPGQFAHQLGRQPDRGIRAERRERGARKGRDKKKFGDSFQKMFHSRRA